MSVVLGYTLSKRPIIKMYMLVLVKVNHYEHFFCNNNRSIPDIECFAELWAWHISASVKSLAWIQSPQQE